MTVSGTNRRFERREFLKMSGVAFAGVYTLSLVGCGSEEGSGNGGGGKLRISWWGNDDRRERTLEVLNLFREENPDVVEGVEFSTEAGSYAGYFDRLATQTAGGNAPDIMQMGQAELVQYGEQGTLLELDQFVPDLIDLSGYDDQLSQAGTVNDSLVSLPLGAITPCLIYNQTLLDEAGLQMPGSDWTWQDFRSLASDLSEAGGEDFYGTEDLGGYGQGFGYFLRQRGKESTTAEGQLGFEKEDLVEYFSYWDELRQQGIAVPADIQAQSPKNDKANSPLIQGQTAMIFFQDFQLPAYQELTEDELGLNTYPGGEPGGPQKAHWLIGAHALSGYAQTDYQDLVAQLINFFINDRGAIEILGVERGIPPTEKAREIVQPELSEVEQKVLDYNKTVRESHLGPPIPQQPGGGSERGEAFQRAYEEIAFGRASIDEAAEQYIAAAQETLE